MITPAVPKSWYLPSKPHKFCPGCGHGIVLKALGETIDELEIQDKTIFGCDIGCSLLSWDFFACDSTQTHHGRTTPVMVGIKRARPELITIGYMGDGGGYSIGSQHLLNAAVRNENVTLILVNNTNYGMTGGQMAPTSLLGQVTQTSPYGREAVSAGYPIKVCELLSTLDGVALAQRVTVDSVKNIRIAKKAIKRAFQNQIDGKGYSIIEIVSTCPTNWGLSPVEALQWLRDNMLPYYPLGVYKDKYPQEGSEV